jgi:hypothetical protein
MRLHGYIHARTHFQATHATEGYIQFRTIFLNRPSDCRYAVVEVIPEEYLVIDLFDTQFDNNIFTPGGMRSHPTLNAAILAGILLYEPHFQ